MAQGNKNLSIDCRFLHESDAGELFETFNEAFSDYFVSFRFSETQFRNHVALNSVDLDRSVGAFHAGKMVGFTLNGFGTWNDRRTVYDAGTGVVPAFRNRGVGRMIFDFMMPQLSAGGFEQILLEVLTQNKYAIRLYENLGFEPVRRLLYFEYQNVFDGETRAALEVFEIAEPEWQSTQRFFDGQTSWQNSSAAMRQTSRKVVLIAQLNGAFAGYGIFFPTTGVITQIAIAPEFRRRGAASALLREMQKRIGKDKTLRASNVDENIASAVGFLKGKGFVETLSQIEMIKTL